MKPQATFAIIISLSLGVCARAGAESLSTADGATYNHITLQRVDPDGLYIEYTPSGGGVGMSKIKFSRLSEEQRKQFGYDEAKARDYAAQCAKETEQWRAEAARMEQEGRAHAAAQKAESSKEEAMENERIMALAQLKQAEAELARVAPGADDYSTLGSAGFAVAIPQTGRPSPQKTQNAPVARPFVRVIPDRAR